MKRSSSIIVFIFLLLFVLGSIFSLTGFHNLFGSMTDWLSQHVIYPDYFRKLFYQTGNLIPNFAFNLGAGQNIYYFSYYGFLSPYVLFSYLLPFIKMIDYLIVLNILIIVTSGFLFYKWLINNKIKQDISLITTILFVLAGPFIFQAHRHIMFINYMPFLILGLMGVDKYFSNHKSGLFIISIFLMIMTSYYYSVCGLLTLFIYGVYKYISLHKLKFKSFIIDMIKFIWPMLIGIIMASIILIPTLMTLISRDTSNISSFDIKSLLLPSFNSKAIMYSSYGIGLTGIFLIAIIYHLLQSKKEKLFLVLSMITITMIPIFMLILNGMLYSRSKAFIPLLPLGCLLIAHFIMDFKNNKMNNKLLLIILFISLILYAPFNIENCLFYLDLFLMITFLIYSKYLKNIRIFYGILFIAAIGTFIVNNKSENFVGINTYNNVFNKEVSSLINKTIDQDKSIYRFNNLLDNNLYTVNEIYNSKYYSDSLYSSTYNSDYHELFNSVNAFPYRNSLITAQSNNIMFQMLMGVKYIAGSRNDAPIGYELVSGDSNKGVYKNNNVFPLGYASNKLMSKKYYDNLSFPYNLEALLNNVIVNNDVVDISNSNIKPIILNYDYVIDDNLNISKNNDTVIIDNKKDSNITLKLKEPIKNQILLVSFDILKPMNCKDGDTSITINNITNKLTCKQWLYFNDNYHFKYVISSPDDISDINITINKGYMEIKNIETYVLDYDKVSNLVNNLDPLIIDYKNTKGDKIVGNIKVTNDGYFATTIPYDKGFTVLLNNKKIKYEEINNAFIGLPIKKGNYKIEIKYQTPGYIIGLCGSLTGLLIYVIIILKERKKD